jgi:hypothetical protein
LKKKTEERKRKRGIFRRHSMSMNDSLILPEAIAEQKYIPIGMMFEDFLEEKITIETKDDILIIKSHDNLKKVLYKGISEKVRAYSWKKLLKYLPLDPRQEEKILKEKREDYKSFQNFYNQKKIELQNDSKIIDLIELIRKDVNRTLPDSYFFRDKNVQESMIRILTIYSIRYNKKTSFYFLLTRNERHPRSLFLRLLC